MSQRPTDYHLSTQNPQYQFYPEARRNLYVFPPGVADPGATNTVPIQLNPPQLEDYLKSQVAHDPVQHIYVTSLEYCKQLKKPWHEFIIVSVKSDDQGAAPLENFIVLDRTTTASSDRAAKHIVNAVSNSQLYPAQDMFRISYNGSIKNLLNHCNLSKYEVLEKLVFRNEAFLLYELAALSKAISSRHQFYNALKYQCFWYANLVWECIIQVLQSSTFDLTRSASAKMTRGDFGKIHYLKVSKEETLKVLVAFRREHFISERYLSEVR
ncbi:Rho guanine nucleotide exchange factor 6 [Ceratobasidium sp. AG-Ba]|nr:Rho guanine nucleotide exchange factor 6 [Ceratobasidium sp. AG-Ba]